MGAMQSVLRTEGANTVKEPILPWRIDGGGGPCFYDIEVRGLFDRTGVVRSGHLACTHHKRVLLALDRDKRDKVRLQSRKI